MSQDLHTKWPTIGEIDRLTAMVGQRGVGKTQQAVFDALEFRRETGAYLLGQSPGARLPYKLHDGTPSTVRYHDSLKALRRGLGKNPELFHVLVGEEHRPEDLLAYAESLSDGVIRAGYKRQNIRYRKNRPPDKPIHAPPILVVIDEGTAMKESMTAEEKRQWKMFLTGLRHKHISLTWLIQAPTAKEWILMEQTNRMFAFRYVHEWGLNGVRAAGVPQDDIPLIRELPRFEYRYYEFSGKRANDL